MNLAYGVYNATAQQLETAKMKVQEQTPCITVIEPASVPIYQSKPRKSVILIGFMFLGAVCAMGYILSKDLFFQKRNNLLNCKKQPDHRPGCPYFYRGCFADAVMGGNIYGFST